MEYRRLELYGQPRRKNQCERIPLASYFDFKGSTTRAAIDMRAGEAPRQNLAADGCHVLADLGAGVIASPPSAHERLTRLEYQRLDLLAVDVQHLSNLVVRVIPQLKQDECRTLVCRQALDLLHQLA